jgi:hypothetical protein
MGGGKSGQIANTSDSFGAYFSTTASPMYVAGTLSNFTIHFAVAVSKATTVTVQKNGSNTAITCPIASGGTTCSDGTHTVAFAVTDTLLVRLDGYSGSNNGTNPAWSATYG